MTLGAALPILQVAAAALACVVAARRARYRPVAAFLVAVVVASTIRRVLVAEVIRPAQDAIRASGLDPFVEPLRGIVRAAGHFDQALFLVWPLGIAALALRVFLRRRPWGILAAAAATMLVLVLGYHHLRGESHQRVLLPVELAALAVSLGSAVQWAWKRMSPHIEHAAVILVVLLECVVALTYSGSLVSLWPLARGAYSVLYCGLVVVEGGALCWKCGFRRSA